MGSFAVSRLPATIVAFTLTAAVATAAPLGAQSVFLGATLTQEDSVRSNASLGALVDVTLPVAPFVSIGGGLEARYFSTGDSYTANGGNHLVMDAHGLVQVGPTAGRVRPFAQASAGLVESTYAPGRELVLSFGGGIGLLSSSGGGWQLGAHIRMPQKQEARETPIRQWAIHIGRAF